MKKVLFSVLFIMGITWIGGTLYFYSQHNVTVIVSNVEEEINLGDMTIFVDQVIIRNYEMKPFDFDNGFYKISQKIPKFLVEPVYDIYTFYTRPYEFNNKLQYTLLKTRLLIDEPIGEKSEAERLEIRDNINISLVDHVGVVYSQGGSWSTDSNSNVIHHEIRGEMFPIERINEPLTIKITDKRDDTTHEIPIDIESFTKERYNFFNKSPY
ncbi:MAG: hypothetical protein CVV02_15085 [Firmicutes bacterium HGW-Firmicutes-7]|nr:MAG: hypothetical protein CVV02_15085 [Firmicutes bacterium HGW-Firmicutes-7]